MVERNPSLLFVSLGIRINLSVLHFNMAVAATEGCQCSDISGERKEKSGCQAPAWVLPGVGIVILIFSDNTYLSPLHYLSSVDEPSDIEQQDATHDSPHAYTLKQTRARS